MSTRSRAAVEADLRRVGEAITKGEADLEALYTHRENLVLEGRTVTPPIEHSVAAQLLGLTGEASVWKIARKAQKRRAAQAPA